MRVLKDVAISSTSSLTVLMCTMFDSLRWSIVPFPELNLMVDKQEVSTAPSALLDGYLPSFRLGLECSQDNLH
jgi:hypothetical protein